MVIQYVNVCTVGGSMLAGEVDHVLVTRSHNSVSHIATS